MPLMFLLPMRLLLLQLSQHPLPHILLHCCLFLLRVPAIHLAITAHEASTKFPGKGKFLRVLGAGLPIKTRSCSARASSHPMSSGSGLSCGIKPCIHRPMVVLVPMAHLTPEELRPIGLAGPIGLTVPAGPCCKRLRRTSGLKVQLHPPWVRTVAADARTYGMIGCFSLPKLVWVHNLLLL